MSTKKTAAKPSATEVAKQVEGFIDKFDPAMAKRIREVRAALRKRFPTAIEMVYDNYNALVIGFVPNERASDAIFSIVLYPKYVTLFFFQGAGMPDPHGRLSGSGGVSRHVRLESAATLDDPDIVSLMNTALHRAKVPLDPKQPRRLIIKSIAAKQRPRRPPEDLR